MGGWKWKTSGRIGSIPPFPFLDLCEKDGVEELFCDSLFISLSLFHPYPLPWKEYGKAGEWRSFGGPENVKDGEIVRSPF